MQQVLINRDFARLWAASAISGFGDSIFETTLLVWIVGDLAEDRPWAALVVGGLLAASALPVLLVGPFADVLVDRWHDKRRVLLRANILSAVLVAALLPVAVAQSSLFGGGARADAIRLGLVLAVVVLASAVAQFLRPASGVLSRDIVPEAERARAAGLSQSAANITMLVTPTIAAPVLITFGPGVALIVNVASFVAAYVIVRQIAVGHPEDSIVPTQSESSVSPGMILSDMAAGLRFFFGSQVLKTISITICVATLGFGALNALDIFFLRENLGPDDRYYSLLESAQGAGMIAGAVAWGVFAWRVGQERTFWLTLIALGLLILVYSRLTSFPPALLLMVTIGTVVPGANIALAPIMQRETPRHFLGRVSATLNPMITGASLIGMFLGKVLYGTVLDNLDARVWGVAFGPIDTLYLAIGLLTVVAGVYAALHLRSTQVDTSVAAQPGSVPDRRD